MIVVQCDVKDCNSSFRVPPETLDQLKFVSSYGWNVLNKEHIVCPACQGYGAIFPLTPMPSPEMQVKLDARARAAMAGLSVKDYL